ncbi:MAG: hypothetical protein MJ016_07950 [Victivallaceae bacterium]|nr:hypothetical protein [Victivallaceae bacterium]
MNFFEFSFVAAKNNNETGKHQIGKGKKILSFSQKGGFFFLSAYIKGKLAIMKTASRA